MRLINKKITKEVFIELVRDFSALGSVSFHIFALIFVLIIDVTLLSKYVITMAATYFVLIILRSNFFMKRPKKGKPYKTLLGKIDHNSKFSSHSASSFAFAIVIGLNTNTAILVFLLIFASLIGLSRIKLGRHYPLNVFNGSLIGIAVGLIMNLVVF